MVRRVVLAVVVGVITTLVVGLLGALLATIDNEVTQTLGNLLKGAAVVLGILAAIWYYFTGRTPNDAL